MKRGPSPKSTAAGPRRSPVGTPTPPRDGLSHGMSLRLRGVCTEAEARPQQLGKFAVDAEVVVVVVVGWWGGGSHRRRPDQPVAHALGSRSPNPPPGVSRDAPTVDRQNVWHTSPAHPHCPRAESKRHVRPGHGRRTRFVVQIPPWLGSQGCGGICGRSAALGLWGFAALWGWAGTSLRGHGPKGGLKGGWEGGKRRSEQRLGGNVLRVPNGAPLGADRSDRQ